jgi:predicted DsbA family dithiol-disulfide isomerase
MTTKIDVFVDYVCPFCFLVGLAKELERGRDVEVTIRPSELRPDRRRHSGRITTTLPRVWKQSVYPMSNRVGLPITLPSISPQPRPQKAFMVLQLAQGQGEAEAYRRAMFAAAGSGAARGAIRGRRRERGRRGDFRVRREPGRRGRRPDGARRDRRDA